jgi:hypothetical protein
MYHQPESDAAEGAPKGHRSPPLTGKPQPVSRSTRSFADFCRTTRKAQRTAVAATDCGGSHFE